MCTQEVKANPNNYDAWFDYLRLMKAYSDHTNDDKMTPHKSNCNFWMHSHHVYRK